MQVKNKQKKVSKTFFDGDMKNMIRDNFQVKGWKDYSESPYAIHKKGMEELGYGERIKPGCDSSDS